MVINEFVTECATRLIVMFYHFFSSKAYMVISGIHSLMILERGRIVRESNPEQSIKTQNSV